MRTPLDRSNGNYHEDGKMQTLLSEVKKPPTNSHDYKMRRADRKRRVADGNAVKYAVEMSESDLDSIWKRMRPEDKAKLINDWFSGK